LFLIFGFFFSDYFPKAMSNPSERTPLINDIQIQSHSSGSVVSYSFSQHNCANVTMKDRSAAQSTKKKLWFAVALACCFFITELIAGYFANSLGKSDMDNDVWRLLMI
jgi:zinc transporter 2/zinc transporter 4